jgi:hypothetical protein
VTTRSSLIRTSTTPVSAKYNETDASRGIPARPSEEFWSRRSLPVHTWIAMHENDEGVASVDAIATDTVLSPDRVDAEVERLVSDGLVQDARVIRMLGPASKLSGVTDLYKMYMSCATLGLKQRSNCSACL